MMEQEARRALWCAVSDGDEAAVRAALAAEPDLATGYEEYDYQPTTVMTMLHVAAARDHTGIMAMLLAAGADPGAGALPDRGRLTPLHCAARGAGAAVKVLLEAGADPNACIKRGVTPLYTAAYNGNLEGCRLLLAAGAHPEGRPSSSVPLFAAAMESQLAVITLLLSSGASLQKKNSKKETALHHAAHRGDVETNRHLLALGLDPDQPDKKGQTPRMLAAGNLTRQRDAVLALYAQGPVWPRS
jgi:ankyrin repeat protein